MATFQLLPRQNRNGTLTFTRAIPSGLLGKGFSFILDTTEALHNNPAESVQFLIELSYDNQASWIPVSVGGAWPGGPVGLGKNGLPWVRSLGLVVSLDGQGRAPTHARGTYVVVGTVNFGVIVQTDD